LAAVTGPSYYSGSFYFVGGDDGGATAADSSASTSSIVGKGAGGMGTRGNDGARQTGDIGSGGDGDTSNSVTHNLPMAPVVAQQELQHESGLGSETHRGPVR
jgi:hypothetical protein